MLTGIINLSSELGLRKVVFSLLEEANKAEATQPVEYFRLHPHPQQDHVRVLVTLHAEMWDEQAKKYVPDAPQTFGHPHLEMPSAVLSEFKSKWQHCEEERVHSISERISTYRVDCFKASQPK